MSLGKSILYLALIMINQNVNAGSSSNSNDQKMYKYTFTKLKFGPNADFINHGGVTGGLFREPQKVSFNENVLFDQKVDKTLDLIVTLNARSYISSQENPVIKYSRNGKREDGSGIGGGGASMIICDGTERIENYFDGFAFKYKCTRNDGDARQHNGNRTVNANGNSYVNSNNNNGPTANKKPDNTPPNNIRKGTHGLQSNTATSKNENIYSFTFTTLKFGPNADFINHGGVTGELFGEPQKVSFNENVLFDQKVDKTLDLIVTLNARSYISSQENPVIKYSRNGKREDGSGIGGGGASMIICDGTERIENYFDGFAFKYKCTQRKQNTRGVSKGRF